MNELPPGPNERPADMKSLRILKHKFCGKVGSTLQVESCLIPGSNHLLSALETETRWKHFQTLLSMSTYYGICPYSKEKIFSFNEGSARRQKGKFSLMRFQMVRDRASGCNAINASMFIPLPFRCHHSAASSFPFLRRHSPHCRPSFLEFNGIIYDVANVTFFRITDPMRWM